MIETVLLVGGPLDGRRLGSSGGNVLTVPGVLGQHQRLEYRRAHDESKFFHFQKAI
jgi:hypothetical protein